MMAAHRADPSTRTGNILLLLLFLTISSTPGLPAPPESWLSVGAGGGGAMFAPSFSPHNPNELYAACDMSGLYHSTDLGASWTVLPFGQAQGNRACRVQFTSNQNTLYTLNFKPIGLVDSVTPSNSVDGGITWDPLPSDPTGGEAYELYADPDSTTRVLVNSWSQLFFSGNSGGSFSARYTAVDGGAGLYVGGVFFDGTNIFVGTNDGLLVSTNGGTDFALSPVSGIPTSREIISFTGARQGSTVRLFALVGDNGSTWNGMGVEDFFWGHKDVYTLDWGQPAWVLRTTGLPTSDEEGLAFIAAARNNIATAYVSGQNGIEYPIVYKTTDGGITWQSVLLTTNNQNIATGWDGYRGDRDWWYGGGTVGFAVAPNDANRAAFTDYGFLHLTNDGGSSWRQAYVNPADQNPAGAQTPKGRSYRGNGLENTSCWWVTWSDTDNLFASCTDIRGMRSTSGGTSWSFDYAGHTENTAYQVLKHPTSGTLYMATSSVHDMYESTYLQDSRIDGGTGRVLSSTDNGATWQVLHDFGHPVIFLAFNPSNANRLYASVIHSTAGGIFVSHNIQAGSASTWTKLANPPRTEGHPFNVHVLNDGTLVCTYSGRRNSSGAFTASSGVFVSTDGGVTWADRSHTGMRYWTKDVVIDSHDPAQNRWYCGVFSGWGGPPNGLGGLYRTTDRGQNWTRISSLDRVESCAISPVDSDEMYVTTEIQGLWHTASLNAGSPTFSPVDSYPFRHPVRVFFSPLDTAKVWVTSFGNGLRFGTAPGSRIAEWQDY